MVNIIVFMIFSIKCFKIKIDNECNLRIVLLVVFFYVVIYYFCLVIIWLFFVKKYSLCIFWYSFFLGIDYVSG